MTGYGKGCVSSEAKTITFEVKSLNSKQFDLSMRMPHSLRECELEVRNILGSSMQRGKVEATATVENRAVEPSSVINYEILSHYKDQIMTLADKLQIAWPSDWYGTLLRMPDAMVSHVAELSEDDKNALTEAVKEALGHLTEFRATEGAKLETFFKGKIQNISDLLEQTTPYEQERVPKIRQRLVEQLAKLPAVEYDKGRLEQELIFYIEKLDVTEEKVRLRSHLDYFLKTLEGEPGQGKKLGFIAQEMGREINTMGSKANSAELQQIVVRMKDELEQIKEQVLNVL